jgi:sulfonate transport system ATP-binding protein
MTTSLLDIRNVSKAFTAQGEEFLALSEIDLRVSPGELVCVVGGSGCGKTTLLRIIGGLERSSRGAVLLENNPVQSPGPDRGFVFQEHRLLPWLTVSDNIGFGLLHNPASDRKNRIDHYLKLVGLEDFGEWYPHQLSGGMAQRVAMARALAPRPRVLLLDEPFGALDALSRIRMQEEILRIWEQEGTTMILVTHDIEEAIYLADRVVIMAANPGRIRQEVQVDLPRPRDRSDYAFLAIRKQIYAQFFPNPHVSPDYAI